MHALAAGAALAALERLGALAVTVAPASAAAPGWWHPGARPGFDVKLEPPPHLEPPRAGIVAVLKRSSGQLDGWRRPCPR